MSEKIAIILTLEYYTILGLASLALIVTLLLKRWLKPWNLLVFLVLSYFFVWFYQVQQKQTIVEIEWIKV